MLTAPQINDVIDEQMRYARACRTDTCITRADAPELRKEWLKHTFGSFSYHENLLGIHAAWLDVIYAGLARPEVKRHYPEQYDFLNGPARNNFDKAPRPAQLDPACWKPGRQTGWARSILDYGRDTGLDVMSTWDWMKPDEQSRMFPLWGTMDRLATNIRRTVDNTWGQIDDNILLNEMYTGPINWPANWRDEVRLANLPTQAPTDAPPPHDGGRRSQSPARRRL
jgi:hypothetical protein